MTTATVTAVIDTSTDAAFRTWVQEIITALFTTVGATQTADTGQINTTTVTRAGVANTVAGYVIGRFNDTAQATSPIFFKLEFGAGNVATTSPGVWITVGTGSNGAGTLTGTTTARAEVLGGVPGSIVTSYVSRYVYNATQGYMAISFKQGAVSAGSLGGFVLERSNNASGAVTTDAYMLVATASAGSPSAQGGSAQVYSYLSVALVTLPSNTSWAASPFGVTTTLFSGGIQVFPVWKATPVLGVSSNTCVALATEVPAGNTISLALVGATTHTYLSVPPMWGGTVPAGITGGNTMILWE